MAIISCPYCGHKTSDKGANCVKCNGDLASLTPEKRAALSRDKAIDQAQSLVNHSMFALLLFLAGFGLMYWWILKRVVCSNILLVLQLGLAFVGI